MGLLLIFGKFTHNNIIKYSDKYKGSKDNIPLYYSKDTEKNVTVSFYKLSQIIKKNTDHAIPDGRYATPPLLYPGRFQHF